MCFLKLFVEIIKDHRRVILLLGLYFAWVLSFPLWGPAMVALGLQMGYDPYLQGCLFAIANAIALLFLARYRRHMRIDRKVTSFAMSLSLTATAAFLLIPAGYWYISSILSGLASGIVVAYWSELFVATVPHHLRGKVMAFAISLANSILYLVLVMEPVLPSELALILTLLPLGGGIMLLLPINPLTPLPDDVLSESGLEGMTKRLVAAAAAIREEEHSQKGIGRYTPLTTRWLNRFATKRAGVRRPSNEDHFREATKVKDATAEEGIALGEEGITAISTASHTYLPLNIVFFIFAFYLVGGFLYQYLYSGLTSHFNLIDRYYSTLPYMAAALWAGLEADKKGRRELPIKACQLLGMSLVIPPLIADRGIKYLASRTLALGAYGYSDLFLWVALADIAGTTRRATPSYGIGIGINLLAVVTGSSLTRLFPLVFTEDSTLATAIGSGLLFLILGPIIRAMETSYPHLEREMEWSWKAPKEGEALTESGGGCLLSKVKGQGAPVVKEVPPEAQGDKVPAPDPITTELRSLIAKALEPLTSREEEIFHLLAAGLSNKEIQEMLHLSEGTVKTHLRNIYRKTGFLNRKDLLHHLLSATANVGPEKGGRRGGQKRFLNE